jgi:lipopolysaccharide/colanic/teichoic acid biosynthesis glycosyltransferase
VTLRRAGNGSALYPLLVDRVLGVRRSVLDEESFSKVMSLERKRTERSRKPFLLMLLELGSALSGDNQTRLFGKIASALLVSSRETDVTGWYKHHCILGIMFTELVIDGRSSILSTMLTRVANSLKDVLTIEQLSQIRISFHLFPEDWDQQLNEARHNLTLYPDVVNRHEAHKFFAAVKRLMDIVGSAIALILCAPVFAAVALAIKMSSKGPVVFKQRRVGQHGELFTFLKFRSMYVDSNSTIHKEYVKNLIAGHAAYQPTKDNGHGVYKLTRDPRITTIGAFLRRTSLDELPQLLNVLRGEMSLVGPRPPVPYEVESYEIWHRRRLLEAKPGITGLWQVSGRNRLRFDDMVRLDLAYARSWSPWLDIKILIRTPLAVCEGGH